MGQQPVIRRRFVATRVTGSAVLASLHRGRKISQHFPDALPFVRSRVAHRKSAGYMNVAYVECMSKAVEGMALATFEGRQEGYLMA